MKAGIDQLSDIVRRDICRHAHSDPCGAVGEEIGKGRRQNRRLFETAIVVGAIVYRVFGQTFEHRFGNHCHARFCVTRGGRVIAVDIAEVALSVNERIAHVEVLCEASHRIIDRSITVRVEITHCVARNLCRLEETACRTEAQAAHRIEDTAVHGFEAITGIGQRTVHDRGERIGEIALANGAAQRL